jgi:hypothetical protein
MATLAELQKQYADQERVLAGTDYARNKPKEQSKLNAIQREMDIVKGQETIGKEFAPGKLGRLDAGRSTEMTDIIAKKKAGLSGISAEENQALRERGKQGIQRSTQTALRSLRGFQGSRGVRGEGAITQQAGILKSGIQSQANVERDLLLKNIDAKRTALSDYEASVSGAESVEQEKSLYNINQANRETFGRLSSGLGYAQLGVADRASERGVAIAQQNLSAESGGGKI